MVAYDGTQCIECGAMGDFPSLACPDCVAYHQRMADDEAAFIATMTCHCGAQAVDISYCIPLCQEHLDAIDRQARIDWIVSIHKDQPFETAMKCVDFCVRNGQGDDAQCADICAAIGNDSEDA